VLKIYHNPRCRKSREALLLLQEEKVEYEVILYLENPLTKDALQALLEKIKLQPSDLVRKNEKEWKAIPDRNTMSESQILDALVSFPKLIERPIVEGKTSGVLARPIENLIEFLKAN
jgi:arsenate reductase|tara:strand:- start:3067 stop:3417 length:351 start_codon:yes stop_codon:yes gene_type:complete